MGGVVFHGAGDGRGSPRRGRGFGGGSEASGRILAMPSFSSREPGARTILAVFTDHLTSFPPSLVEVIDSSGTGRGT